MSYVDAHLLPNERVTYRTRIHWMVYTPAMLLLVAGVIIAFAAASALHVQFMIGTHLGFIPGAIIMLIGLFMAFVRWVRVKTSEFAVTDKRVVIKAGLLRRRSVELLLRQVETIGVDQSIMGRIFGYGILTINGTGGSSEVFPHISHPLEFRRQVQMQIAAK